MHKAVISKASINCLMKLYIKWFDAFYLFQPSPIMLSLYYTKYQFCRRNMNIQTIPFIFDYITLTVLCTRQLFQKPQLIVLWILQSMHYAYIFHFIVKSYVHWCPTELVLGLLMSGILPLAYRKQPALWPWYFVFILWPFVLLATICLLSWIPQIPVFCSPDP